MKALLALLAGLVAVAATGCGSGGGGCPAGGTGSVQHEGGGATRYLTAVDVGRSACGDRIAFRFDAAAPGYRVAYESADRAQTEDASGRHIPVAGTAFLVVRLSPAATARADGDALERTYTGRRRIAGDGAKHVRELVKTGDFEAVLTWAVGLDSKRPFTVSVGKDTLTVEIR